MNLKELGVLLIGLYIVTILLIAYKYYKAKGGVYWISRVLVFKYILRFLSLIIILFLTYTTLVSKQTLASEINNKATNLVAVSSKSTSQTWDQVKNKVIEMSPNGEYELIVFEPQNAIWHCIIPATNKEAFINLIEHAKDTESVKPKRTFTGDLPFKPSTDQFGIFRLSGNKWINLEVTTSNDFFFTKNYANSWSQTAYVPLYLVILALFLVFIDIVFSVKGIKI